MSSKLCVQSDLHRAMRSMRTDRFRTLFHRKITGRNAITIFSQNLLSVVVEQCVHLADKRHIIKLITMICVERINEANVNNHY